MDSCHTGTVRALLASVLFLHSFHFRFCTVIDFITPYQSVSDGNNIISSGKRFELGFFSPINSSHRYIGLWYKKVPKRIVWVANRENPIFDYSGVLTINNRGNLVVLDGKENILWSANDSIVTNNSVAKLLDSGNLVLREGNSDTSNGKIMWQLFDHPADSFLPRMKLSANPRANKSQMLRAWKSASDPSVGSFSIRMDAQVLPQLSIWKELTRYWRTGPWNGQIFVGVQNMSSFYLNGITLVIDNQGVIELSYAYSDASYNSFFALDPSGKLQQLTWDEQKGELFVELSQPDNDCDVYNTCGQFGSCNPLKSPICGCLRGFEPKSREEWENGNWSGGCVRRNHLKCERNLTRRVDGEEDWFFKLEKVKLPDFPDWLDSENAEDCQERCLSNCSCLAYAFHTNMNCMLWAGGLIDIQKFTSGGMDLYIRLADSELDRKRDVKVITTITAVVGTVMISICICFYLRCKKKRGMVKAKKEQQGPQLFDMFASTEASNDPSSLNMPTEDSNPARNLELPLFDIGKLVSVTDNFSAANKLGEGGFGPVYKGKIAEGKEIAVKRLSKSSGQGLQEFKNEVKLIAKLQHRNLVRLLGYCIEGEEKMLVYEYMPNKSLDAFLFDPTKQGFLDWPKRFHIVEGIARGLLYLHRDSRLRIIHRDLKASNILLDGELNPKISDFGLARGFGGNQVQANTRRIVGTYGYMSPEYAMEGQFSEKSDVFSFGVLLLEIVSGRRNTSFYHHEVSKNLLSYARHLWNEDKLLVLTDPALSETYSQPEVLRCIHVGLLCVQEFAADRPTMSSIVLMLGSEIALPNPKQPAFADGKTPELASETESINNVSITMFQGR